jgi:hypothetical protein
MIALAVFGIVLAFVGGCNLVEKPAVAGACIVIGVALTWVGFGLLPA